MKNSLEGMRRPWGHEGPTHFSDALLIPRRVIPLERKRLRGANEHTDRALGAVDGAGQPWEKPRHFQAAGGTDVNAVGAAGAAGLIQVGKSGHARSSWSLEGNVSNSLGCLPGDCPAHEPGDDLRKLVPRLGRGQHITCAQVPDQLCESGVFSVADYDRCDVGKEPVDLFQVFHFGHQVSANLHDHNRRGKALERLETATQAAGRPQRPLVRLGHAFQLPGEEGVVLINQYLRMAHTSIVTGARRISTCPQGKPARTDVLHAKWQARARGLIINHPLTGRGIS